MTDVKTLRFDVALPIAVCNWLVEANDPLGQQTDLGMAYTTVAEGQAGALADCEGLSKQDSGNIKLCVVVDKDGGAQPGEVHAHSQESWWRQLIKFVVSFLATWLVKTENCTGSWYKGCQFSLF